MASGKIADLEADLDRLRAENEQLDKGNRQLWELLSNEEIDLLTQYNMALKMLTEAEAENETLRTRAEQAEAAFIDYDNAVSELIGTMNQEGDRGVRHTEDMNRVFHLQNETQDKWADLYDALTGVSEGAAA